MSYELPQNIRAMLRLIIVLASGLLTQGVWAACGVTTQPATPWQSSSAGTIINSWDNTNTSYPDDDDKVTVNIGFSFPFGGVNYTQMRIHINGLLDFGANQNLHQRYTNAAIPYNNANRFIAAYWEDLRLAADTEVSYRTFGSAPNRYTVVSWQNMRHYNGPGGPRYTFQAEIHESGAIYLRYNGPTSTAVNSANGSSATIGVEVNNGDSSQQVFNANNGTGLQTDQVVLSCGTPTIEITHTLSNANAAPNDTVTHTAIIDNVGDGGSDQVQLLDDLSRYEELIFAGTPFVCTVGCGSGISLGSPTYSVNDGATYTGTPSAAVTDFIVPVTGVLQPGESITVTFQTRVR